MLALPVGVVVLAFDADIVVGCAVFGPQVRLAPFSHYAARFLALSEEEDAVLAIQSRARILVLPAFTHGTVCLFKLPCRVGSLGWFAVFLDPRTVLVIRVSCASCPVSLTPFSTIVVPPLLAVHAPPYVASVLALIVVVFATRIAISS